MSRHEGVSCDSCLKGNFRGRRYKCLICYDYDLCAACYEAGATTTRHTTEHPMQCILTRADFELYYGGEALTSVEQPQAYTCPYCNRMGFTDQTLQEHVTNEHSDISFEVVCPVCASVPGGDPNLMTDDFAGHLTLEHRSGPRDLISFLDEPVSTRHNVRRIPHTSRGVTGSRSRRSNMHFSTLTNSTTNLFSSVGQGSSGDDDRDRDRNNRRFQSLPDAAKTKDDETENEENDPNIKVVWLYPLDADGNLIIPEDEAQTSAPETMFEASSNSLFGPDSRRVFFNSPPNNPTGDSAFSPISDSVTWHSLPLEDIPTVSTYDIETSFNSLNISGSSEATHSVVDPSPSTSTMPTVGSSRPWRPRSFYPYTPLTLTTNSATVVTSSSTVTNPNPGRYVIPQRRVHFQTSNTTTSEVVFNSGTRTEQPLNEAHSSNARVHPSTSTSGDNESSRREAPRTIFFSDTASTSSDSDTNNTSNRQPRNVNSEVGATLRRMQVSDSFGTPSASTHTYDDDVWEPLPPIRDLNTSRQSFEYSQFTPPANESAPNNTDTYWESNPSEQIDQTESNDTDAYADVSSMLNQSFTESGVHFNRRQNQHDIAPRVKDDRLVIPLFRLDPQGNLIYDDDDANNSESSEESSSSSSIEFFAPMDYKFDPVYSPFPSASSSSPSSDDQNDRRPTSHTHGPFGIFPPRRKPKKVVTNFKGIFRRPAPAPASPVTGQQIPILRNPNRVQSLFSMAGAEVSRAPRTTPLISPISSASTSRTSYGFVERGRSSAINIPGGNRNRPRRRSALRTVCGCVVHETPTSSQASFSGFSQPSTSSGEAAGFGVYQPHECTRRRVHFTDPLVVPNTSRSQQQSQPEPPPQLSVSVSDLDEMSLQDLPPLPDSDSSDEFIQPQPLIHNDPDHNIFVSDEVNQGFVSDDSSSVD